MILASLLSPRDEGRMRIDEEIIVKSNFFFHWKWIRIKFSQTPKLILEMQKLSNFPSKKFSSNKRF